MFERSASVLKILCAGLAIFLVFQAVRIAALRNPLGSLRLPVLAPVSTNQAGATNLSSLTPQKTSNAALSTNLVKSAPSPAPASAKNPSLPPRPGAPGQMADLPPAVQEHVDRIVQSEILGPVPRPLPMALLGIGGRYAFIRTATGQSGLIAEGETLGDVKLLRLGTNRALIEHEGQQKELTIFAGFGSETLLPKGKENPK